MPTEYQDGHVGESSFDPPEEYRHPEALNYPVKGSIAAVYPTDDENESRGQVVCDVFCFDMERTLLRVPLLTPAFHQDTAPNEPQARQTISDRKRNIFDGEAWIPSVGTLCVVMWVGRPPNAEPYISHFIPTNFQSLPHANRKKNIFPREAQAVTKFNDSGEVEEEFCSRLQPTESETPRYTRSQNGSSFEIDNRGNINLQATINKEPIEKERYSNYEYETPTVKRTPDPEGNIVLSTRGAKRGNIGLITGKLQTQHVVKTLIVFDEGETREIPIVMSETVDETNEEGNILLQTIDALLGEINAIAEGHINLDTKQRVRLGSISATEAAALGDSLLDWILEQLLFHTHPGVEPGSSETLPSAMTLPDILSEKVVLK